MILQVNRTVLNVSIGIILIILGFVGMFLHKENSKREDALRQQELVKENQLAKTKETEKAIELEKAKAQSLTAKLLLAEEENKKAKREADRKLDEERQKNIERERVRKENTISGIFYLDPRNAKQIRIAHVYYKDDVKVRIERPYGCKTKIFTGIQGTSAYTDFNVPGLFGEKTFVGYLLKDDDYFIIDENVSQVKHISIDYLKQEFGVTLYIGTGITGPQPDDSSIEKIKVSVTISGDGKYSRNHYMIEQR